MKQENLFCRHQAHALAIPRAGNSSGLAILAVLLAALINTANTEALTMRNASRGELLYSTHCVSCHVGQDNWHDKNNATNWISLQAEVRRWQKLSVSQRNDDEVVSVAKYLNNFILYCDNPISN